VTPYTRVNSVSPKAGVSDAQEVAPSLHPVKLAALVVVAAAFAVPSGGAATTPPVRKIVVKPFGPVLATQSRRALYFWNVEKRDFKVHCTGACARAWPPLVVRNARSVPRRIAGVKGVFGTIRRPDGRRQVTWNRLPIYTYAHERPNQVLCDDVDGWFVVRV
jgi:predicted lipoprotein with Yx(FWY)xxD motif